jgi:transposase
VPSEHDHGVGQQFQGPAGATLGRICASRRHQQGFFLAGELTIGPRARILAQCPFQVAFHKAPLGPVHGGTAHRHRARNLFIAAAGIGRQQYLGALEFAGGSFALAQHRSEFTAFGLAQFDPIAYIHSDLLIGGPDESINESKIRRRAQPQRSQLHRKTRPVSGLHLHLLAHVLAPTRPADMQRHFKLSRPRIERWATTGSVAALPGTGHSRSPLEAHRRWLLDLVAAEPDLTLEEIRARLKSEKRLKTGTTSVWRFYERHDITFKKTLRAVEQDRPDVAAARVELKAEQSKLDAPRLVFIDETAVTTKMVRHRGRSPHGERLVASAPHGPWKTLTLVAALRINGLTAPYVIDGAMDGPSFLAYVEQILAPPLRKGDIVFMDNLRTHKIDGVRQARRSGRRQSAILAGLLAGPQSDRNGILEAEDGAA